MDKREQRVIEAFTICVRSGEMTDNYATILINDAGYDWISNSAKELFYEELDKIRQEDLGEPLQVDGDGRVC